ncbi:MAG: alpha/beta hydrolase [Trichocoleus desertorum ATA4-8-CV12]|jgi:haloacetate dehalogenase|nr:alpha/beta hydrolase [Trichocoleus desertorum ATA4-8-CV12]
MFAQFQRLQMQTSSVTINLLKGGNGYPILLLHGYPQTHVMWHKVAPYLAQDFTVVVSDLRGYGDSSKPEAEADHASYAKRVMAQDQVEVMQQLGYQEFYVVGHDRGARVAHRMALDYPQRIKKLAALDIVPTYELYATTDQEFATAYYHWFFLIQPHPLPETLIGTNPEYFLRTCLERWSKKFAAFTPEALAEYIRCFSQTEAIRATCEDYRAGASIDLVHDRADLAQKIICPLLVLWGSQGIIGRKYDVLKIWQERAKNVSGEAIASGHFLPEEAPEATYKALYKFLVD